MSLKKLQYPGSLERDFQSKVIKQLEDLFPGAIVLKNDANYLQGFPDLTILEGRHWGVLETKRGLKSSHQPNQDYYVETCNQYSFGKFINQENLDEVLSDLQQAFRSNW